MSSTVIVASDVTPNKQNGSVVDLRTRNTTLKPDEKEFVQSVRCLLIFESGACILARKLSNLNHI
jgi:hypothetical protein